MRAWRGVCRLKPGLAAQPASTEVPPGCREPPRATAPDPRGPGVTVPSGRCAPICSRLWTFRTAAALEAFPARVVVPLAPPTHALATSRADALAVLDCGVRED